MRGIFLHHALQQPLIWLQPERFRQSHLSARLWSRSKMTQRFDAFMSHSWRTPGSSKLLALLLQNGWLHGLVGWFLMTSLALPLRLLDIIDSPFVVSLAGAGRQGKVSMSPWLLLLGSMGTLLGLVSSVWVPFGSQLCFLDIACVHQGDPELLRRGISNIGGCLSVSSELRVLYHPSYFRSLFDFNANSLLQQHAGILSNKGTNTAKIKNVSVGRINPENRRRLFGQPFISAVVWQLTGT